LLNLSEPPKLDFGSGLFSKQLVQDNPLSSSEALKMQRKLSQSDSEDDPIKNLPGSLFDYPENEKFKKSASDEESKEETREQEHEETKSSDLFKNKLPTPIFVLDKNVGKEPATSESLFETAGGILKPKVTNPIFLQGKSLFDP